ncbi:MAG: hypothetical protein WD187_02915 [Candidatus Woykebacteria bacterium]
MPKKTKEQKMAAALRRMKIRIDQEKRPVPKGAGEKKPPATEYSIDQIKIKSPASPAILRSKEARYDYSYIARDLKTILILSSVAIVIEVGLSLTMRLQFAKLLLRRFGIEI